MPLRDYKNIHVDKSIIREVKSGHKPKTYIEDRLLPPVGISADKIEELDRLTDHKYVEKILGNDVPSGFLEALMFSENQRRRTFRSTWSYEGTVKGVELAQAGFYFLNLEDQVKCAFCHGILGNWEAGVQPMEEHKEHFSFCSFVQGKSSRNIPFDDLGPSDLLEKVMEDDDERESEDPRVVDPRIFREANPANPKYRSHRKRLQSFQNYWPEELNSLIPEMCDAGYWNTCDSPGMPSSAECFFCGGSLEDWDVNDSPWMEHMKWFPKCPYVILNKGPDQIQYARRNLTQQVLHESQNVLYNTSTPAYTGVAEKKKKIRNSDLYYIAYVNVRLSYEQIMEAYQVNNWNQFNDITDLVQCADKIRDNEINPENDRFPQPPQEYQEGFEWKESHVINGILRMSNPIDAFKNVLADLTSCLVCKQPNRYCGAVFRPCRCFALCNTCSSSPPPLPANCPKCRQQIDEIELKDAINYLDYISSYSSQNTN